MMDQRSITYSLSQIDLHVLLFLFTYCNRRCSFIFLVYFVCVCVYAEMSFSFFFRLIYARLSSFRRRHRCHSQKKTFINIKQLSSTHTHRSNMFFIYSMLLDFND